MRQVEDRRANVALDDGEEDLHVEPGRERRRLGDLLAERDRASRCRVGGSGYSARPGVKEEVLAPGWWLGAREHLAVVRDIVHGERGLDRTPRRRLHELQRLSAVPSPRLPFAEGDRALNRVLGRAQ